MSKGNSIKWRKQDTKKVATQVRVFNAKITRTLKAHPEWAEYLPSKITTDSLKEKIQTRQDFNRELNSLNRFMRKGAEMPILSQTGIKTTQWQKKEVGYKVAQINRNRTIEAKKADVSTYKGTMGTIESNNLKPKSYNIDKIKKTDWEKYLQTVDKQIKSNYKTDKMKKYKENYLRAILENLGDSEKAQELYEYVSKLDPEMMYYVYYDDPILQIQFTSDPLPSDTIASSALEHWRTVAEN